MQLMLVNLGYLSDQRLLDSADEVLCLPRSMRAYRNLLGKRRYASTNAPGIRDFWRFHQHVRFAQERRHCQEHPGLGPSHVLGFGWYRSEERDSKRSPVIPHVIHGPLQHRAHQNEIARVEVFKAQSA